MPPPKPTTRQRANSRRPKDNLGKWVSKFTAEAATQVLDAIRAGNYMETAAAYAGVHKDTFYEWLKNGRTAQQKTGRLTALETRFAEFAADVEQALAQAEVRDVAIIGKAAQTQWQAAAWRLERRMPDRYGRRDRVELSGGQEVTHRVVIEAGAAERLRAKLADVITLDSRRVAPGAERALPPGTGETPDGGS